MNKDKTLNEVCAILQTFAAVRAEGIFKLDAVDEVARRTGLPKGLVIDLLDASGVYELREGTTIQEDMLLDTRFKPEEIETWNPHESR
jgi:hypothetical protein